MMKRIILPMLAFVFAIASAFAIPNVEIGFYKTPTGTASGTIDNNRDCDLVSQVMCTVNGEPAYDTSEHAANSPSEIGLLKYNPN